MHTQGTDSEKTYGNVATAPSSPASSDAGWATRQAGNGNGQHATPHGSPLDTVQGGSAFGGEITMRSEGDTLYVSGDIDLYQAPRFRAAGEEHVRAVAQPRIDLSDVPFLDSAGLAVLLVLARQAREQSKSLRVVATGSPRRVLRITGIDRVLTVEEPAN